LLIQLAFPCLLFGPGENEIIFKGGTNAINAPPTDYCLKVFKPFVKKFGIEFDMDVIMRGYYPKGGGIVKLKTKPIASLKPIQVEERGDIVKIEIHAFCSGIIPEHVPKRMAESAAAILHSSLNNHKIEYSIKTERETREKAFGDGTAIMIYAETSTGCILTGSGIGDKGKRAEDVGAEAARHLVNDLKHGGCVDEYLQDQIIIFMALANGVSKVKVGPLSEHTTTSIHFTEMITGAKFTVTETKTEGEDTLLLECTGQCYKNPYL